MFFLEIYVKNFTSETFRHECEKTCVMFAMYFVFFLTVLCVVGHKPA